MTFRYRMDPEERKTRMIPEKPIKHLLVDLDGTLLGNRNLPLSFDFVRQALTTLKQYRGWRKAATTLLEIRRELALANPVKATNDVRVVELFAKRMDLSLDESRKILRESVSIIFPGLKKHFYPIPGSKDFLDWAKDRYPLTLATNPVWPVEIAELRVRWAGIDPSIFTQITHVTRMHACKPHPAYFEEILEQQQLSAEECLLIGDELKMDLPATQVGIRVFIVESPKNASDGKNDPTITAKIQSLNHPRAKALAWKGTYPALRTLLESQAVNTVSTDRRIPTKS